MQPDFECAYCWRSGEIEFASIEADIPDGAILFYKHTSKEKLHEAVSVCARHAYDEETLLVPGIPEAENDKQAIEALLRFRSLLEERL